MSGGPEYKLSSAQPFYVGVFCPWRASVAQKIKKLSETPTTVSIVAKSCKNDIKNKKMPKNKFNQLRQVSAVQNDPFGHKNRFFLRYAL